MLGGLIIGVLLDLPFLSRPNRARLGWAFLFTTGKSPFERIEEWASRS